VYFEIIFMIFIFFIFIFMEMCSKQTYMLIYIVLGM
jgi:hypothetical protein